MKPVLAIAILKAVIIAVITALLISCTSRHDNDDTQFDTNAAEAAETPGEKARRNADTNEEAEARAKVPDAQPADTSSFLTKAFDANLTEIGLGQLGSRKGHSKAIVNFAERMVKDHSAANDELKALATKKGIFVPQECISCEAKFNDFANVIMEEFDQRYAEMMVEEHEAAVKLFEKEAKTNKDNDLKKWAAEKLPVLKHHLSMAQDLNNKLSKTQTSER